MLINMGPEAGLALNPLRSPSSILRTVCSLGGLIELVPSWHRCGPLGDIRGVSTIFRQTHLLLRKLTKLGTDHGSHVHTYSVNAGLARLLRTLAQKSCPVGRGKGTPRKSAKVLETQHDQAIHWGSRPFYIPMVKWSIRDPMTWPVLEPAGGPLLDALNLAVSKWSIITFFIMMVLL